MRWIIRWGVCVVASCVLLLSGSAQAAEKVAIKLNLPPGASWTFDSSQTVESQNKASANGQSQEFSTKMTSHRAGKMEVAASANGEPTSLRITFDDTCDNSMTMGAQNQKAPFAYAGKTVTVTRNADGSVSDDSQGQADPQAASELHAMLIQGNLIFPQQPVAVGEEWKADPKLLAQVTDLKGPDDRAGMTLQLLDVSGNAGARIAKIKISTAIQRSINGINSTVIMQGTAMVDLASGHTISSDLKGPVESSGEQSGPGPGGQAVTYHVEGKGSITSTSSSKMIGGGGNVAVVNPATPPVNPVNPVNPLAAAPTFAGKFTDGKLTVEWTESDGKFSGPIALGDKKFESTAKADGTKATGTFTADGNAFPFEATLDGDTLRFVTAGTTYSLQRQKRPVNPLEGGGGAPAQPTNPLAPGARATPAPPAAGVPQGYALVNATDSGKALATRKEARSIRSALASTLSDLPSMFDGRPKITGAYEDVRDHRSGGAAFTATLHGQRVKGMATCKLIDQGAAVAVVYAKADATGDDWNKLTTANTAAVGAPIAAPVIPPLKPYEFPDGTGTIGIPEGWKTNSTSCNATVVIQGPAGQMVTMGLFFSCVTPDSMAVRTYQSLVAGARRYGTRPPAQTFLVAGWTTPVEIFQTIIPQLNRMEQATGKPGIELDHLEHLSDPTAMLPNGKASLVTYGITEVENEQRVHRQVLAQIEAAPTSNESFLFWITGAAAPDATFKQDLPTMLAIISSLRENAAVIQAKTQQKLDQQNQWFAAQQKSHQELMATYDRYNAAQARNSTIRSRSNDDFSEALRGYRTVEDARTGEKHTADLGNVDNIVDALNSADPGRYKQVPLRDELDPLKN